MDASFFVDEVGRMGRPKVYRSNCFVLLLNPSAQLGRLSKMQKEFNILKKKNNLSVC